MSNKTLSPSAVRALVGEDGTFFRVKFTKRPKKLSAKRIAAGEVAPVEEREMTCRFGVRKHLKGGERAYDFDAKGVIGVWIPEQDRRDDGKDNGYRVIPAEGVQWVKTHGKTFVVVDGELVEGEAA